jgi:hypothetical protein
LGDAGFFSGNWSGNWPGLTGLAKVELPDELAAGGSYTGTNAPIKDATFAGCTSLQVIVMRTTTADVPALQSAAAIPDSVTKIYVPAAKVSDFKAAAYWSDHSDKIRSDASFDPGDDPSTW